MRWLSILGFASAGSFEVFYVYISGLVELGAGGYFTTQILTELEEKNLFHQKTLYAGDTKFLDLPPALNYCNAESNIQINVSLVHIIFNRKNFKHKELFLNKTHDLFKDTLNIVIKNWQNWLYASISLEILREERRTCYSIFFSSPYFKIRTLTHICI